MKIPNVIPFDAPSKRMFVSDGSKSAIRHPLIAKIVIPIIEIRKKNIFILYIFKSNILTFNVSILKNVMYHNGRQYLQRWERLRYPTRR